MIFCELKSGCLRQEYLRVFQYILQTNKKVNKAYIQVLRYKQNNNNNQQKRKVQTWDKTRNTARGYLLSITYLGWFDEMTQLLRLSMILLMW